MKFNKYMEWLGSLKESFGLLDLCSSSHLTRYTI
uniref:Uncharacterized protein n=1 Tax=Anguilla anguilla TaxID=7936 RepID=A0A0E9R9K5_ANGAN